MVRILIPMFNISIGPNASNFIILTKQSKILRFKPMHASIWLIFRRTSKSKHEVVKLK